jgi:stage V sporulation protein G
VEISEVKVKLMRDRADRLKAFCSVTIDREFVIRDLKIIEGTKGMFVAMPSRKITDKCPTCGAKNHLRAKFCNECGGRLNENRAGKDAEGRAKLHADIAHPINSACRERMQKKIVDAYHDELELSKRPDYSPKYDDELEDDYFHEAPHEGASRTEGRSEEPRQDEPRHEEPQQEEPQQEEPQQEEPQQEEPRQEEAEPQESGGRETGEDSFSAGIF